jgi:uncharacterized protein YecT (DUF1311 family)
MLMSKIGFSIMAAILVTPAVTMAKAPNQNSYVRFALTKEELAQMPDAADTACLATAAAKATNENGRINCNKVIYNRLDARLNVAYRTALARVAKAKATMLRADESAWLASRDKICMTRAVRDLNRQSVSYRAAISDCSLTELYRRTLWLERYR